MTITTDIDVIIIIFIQDIVTVIIRSEDTDLRQDPAS